MLDSVPNEATGYVAAAYIFFLALVLVYIAIIGAKLERLGRELGELNEKLEGGSAEATGRQADRETVG
ncbi:MAG: hypothetical protein ACKORM_03230 [Solirubrobacterales bacterium]